MTRILIYDIETSPIEGTTWDIYDTNVVWVDRDWHLMSVAWKWHGQKKTHCIALPDYKLYKKEPRNDLEIVKKLHELFSEADILVAHNGNSFDQKKTQARMIMQGFLPPSPYQQIDTKLVARRYFKFTSNKLDDLGDYLGVGRKLETGGKGLWKACIAGDPKAWAKMKKYNRQDVVLLEKIYDKLLPWMASHPNRATIEGRPEVCPRCSAEEGFLSQGWRITKTGRYRRWQCKSCGSYVHNRKGEKDAAPDLV